MKILFDPFSSAYPVTGHPSRASGFTLLELMIVVFILSALAFSATSVIDEQDSTRINEGRKNETERRWQESRRAVLGDPDKDAFEFVSDMGRLPATDELRELFEQPANCGAGAEACDWQTDAKSGLSSGWRGPYLVAPYEAGATRYFRDGWGNPTKTDFSGRDGWMLFEQNIAVNGAGSLTVQSYGSDGRVGGINYAADYPPNKSGESVPEAMLKATDYQVTVSGLAVTVRFSNPGDGTGPSLPSAATDLRLRLYYPKNGRPEFHESTDTVTLEPINDGAASVGPYPQFTFPLNITVPWGERTLVVVCAANGKPFDGDCGSDNAKFHRLTLKPASSLPGEIPWELQ